MEYRPLNITVIKAEGLQDVKLFSKMDVYAEVSIAGYTQSKKMTFVDKNSGTSPKWNCKMEFIVDEPYRTKSSLSLLFQLKAQHTLGSDKEIGSVTVPINELFRPDSNEDRVVEYQIHTPSGIPKGTLKFSYHFGEKFTQQQAEAKRHVDKPVTGTLAAPHWEAPYPANGYPPQYPPPQQYPPPPPPPGYGAYPQTSGYGYQLPPPGYGYPPPGYAHPPPGYGYPPPGYAHPPPAYGYPPPGYAPYGEPNKMGMGSGPGLGLRPVLLGLVMGEMASDGGEGAAYADGYDHAMNDMGDMGDMGVSTGCFCK
ncbi:hypothetical protein CDL12_18139 [Handroanthus impetiginosus]|uniref:C2 domain-containing protein n=1 Tax=Handroanthus impetiginosus TaxID=429701 RepID=A0A2G9GVJ4_9LAMI|nr:hypothetical protein CDL12_18139 [Handroanthus impetiginosus]